MQPAQLAAGVAAGTLVALDANRPVGGVAQLASYFESELQNNPNTLFLAGAESHISSSRTFYREPNNFFYLKPAALALRKLGLMGRGLALHDFQDESLERLNEIIEISKKKDDHLCTKTLFTAVGVNDPAHEIKNLEKFRIFTVDGVKIAFIEIPDNRSTTNVILDPSLPLSRLFFGSGPISVEPNLDVSIAQANAVRLEAAQAGAEVFILTIFRGFTSAGGAATVSKTEGFDIIYFDNAAQSTAGFLPDKNGRSTFIVEPWSAGDEYARFSFIFDHVQKKITKFIGKGREEIVPTAPNLPDFSVMRQVMVPTFADSRFPDISMLNLLEPFVCSVHKALDEKIGVVTRNLTITPFGTDTVRYANLIADALRSRYCTEIALVGNVDPQQTNATPRLLVQYYQPLTTQLNRTIGELDLVAGDIWDSYYHEQGSNFASTAQAISIDTLFETLEISINLPTSQNFAKYVGVSGFTYTFNPANPFGQRVLTLTLANGTTYTRNPETGLIPHGSDTVSASANSFGLLFAANNNVATYPLLYSAAWIPHEFCSVSQAVIKHIENIGIFNPDDQKYAPRGIPVT